MAEAKEILDKVKSLKSTSDSLTIKRNRGVVNGAFIGMAGGLLVGFTRNYSLVSSAIVGSIMGALVSYLILPKNED